jgi:hypothetical protein
MRNIQDQYGVIDEVPGKCVGKVNIGRNKRRVVRTVLLFEKYGGSFDTQWGFAMKHVYSAAIMLCWSGALLVVSDSPAWPADMTVDSQHMVIKISGDFVEDDVRHFWNLATTQICYRGLCGVMGGVVQLDSPGGLAVVGIRIGEMIRVRQMVTYIRKESFCASACAIAWLGGVKRVVSLEGGVGFHGVYDPNTLQPNAPGNALVGAYLEKLGLSERAMV